MTLVSEFYGIKIYMYWEDHMPPHFHAEYAGNSVMIDIDEAVVIKGVFPGRQMKLVLAWCELHKEELLKNWDSAKDNEEIAKVEPLY